MTKAFALAAKTADIEDAQPLEFNLEGTEEALHIYPPKNAQLALIMASMSEDAEDDNSVALFIDTFFDMCDEATRSTLRKRLKSREDAFDIPDVMEIIKWAIEESTERPTQSPSASTPSRTPTGGPSRAGARRVASTSSTSLPPAAAI